uniref:CSON003345 protein n=1 Tax=Culicoides sonorensis TaxID=179676 RepID=A0A336LM54_CULSO
MSSFHKLCRLCLKKCKPNDYYEDLCQDYSIRCKIAIQEIFNIINVNNNFPAKVCLDCSQKVLDFYDYFVVVQKNQDILINGINSTGTQISIQNESQSIRSLPSLINLNNRHHLSNQNIFEAGTSQVPMDIENRLDESQSNEDTKQSVLPILSIPKPFLTVEERKVIQEKIKLIKDGMSNDEKIKIFYGLKCNKCPNSEFNKLVDYQEHSVREHNVELTSFVCCKTKIKREFLLDHIEYHLGTPAVRVLRPRLQSMGTLTQNNGNNESQGETIINESTSTSTEGEQSNKSTEENGVKFPCSKCIRTYMTKSSLKRHMNTAHSPFCEECNKHFDDEVKLKKHKFFFHSNNGPFTCPHCPNLEYDNRQQLYNHRRWHARQESVNPVTVSEDIDNNELLNTSNKEPPFQDSITKDSQLVNCPYCTGSFHSNRNLKIHMSLKHKNGMIIAKAIKKRYVSPFKKPLDLPRLKCKICGFVSFYRQNLKRHIRIRHPEQADTEEELNSLVDDIDRSQMENFKSADNLLETNKSSENATLQNQQIKQEHDDSFNMYNCLSTSLLP